MAGGYTGGYTGASSDTTPQTGPGKALTVRGRWCFDLRPRAAFRTAASRQRFLAAYMRTMGTRGYKIGVKIRRDQRVVRFSFAGPGGDVVLGESPAVTKELVAAFGAGPGERWVGLLPPPGSRRLYRFDGRSICYRFRLVIRPVRHKPQAVPVVLTYVDVPFKRHYLLDVRVLDDRQRRIRTTVEAMA